MPPLRAQCHGGSTRLENADRHGRNMSRLGPDGQPPDLHLSRVPALIGSPYRGPECSRITVRRLRVGRACRRASRYPSGFAVWWTAAAAPTPGGAGLGAYTTALPAWAVRHRGRFARRATTGQGVAPRPDCVRRSSERPTPPATSAVSSRLAGSMNPARAGLRSGRPKCRRGSSACRLTAVPERGAFGWRQVRAESDQGADGQPPK